MMMLKVIMTTTMMMKWEEKEKEARWLWPSNCYLRLLLSTHPPCLREVKQSWYFEQISTNSAHPACTSWQKQIWRRRRWIWKMWRGSCLVWYWIWNLRMTTIIFFVFLTCCYGMLISHHHHHTTITRMKIWWLLTFHAWVSVKQCIALASDWLFMQHCCLAPCKCVPN